jgi:RimJ/RimL family protein N-acetyltransferase
MEMFLETARLALRRFTEADAGLLDDLDSDPEVMRYLTNGKPTPYEVIRDEVLPRMLAEYRRSASHGHWAAIEKSTGAFLGWFGLQTPAGRRPDEAELGYRLRRSAWGRGYATEGSRALVHKAFAELGLQRVYAGTMTVNLASRRVMEKAGLRYVRTYHLDFDDPIPGTEKGEVEYALTRAEWESAGEARR